MTSTESRQTLCADRLLEGLLIPHIRLVLGSHHFFVNVSLEQSYDKASSECSSDNGHTTLKAPVLV